VPSVFGLSYAPCIGNPDTAIGNDRGRCQVIVRPLVARPSFERALDERVSWTSAAANETAPWNTARCDCAAVLCAECSRTRLPLRATARPMLPIQPAALRWARAPQQPGPLARRRVARLGARCARADDCWNDTAW